jgi:hypothetical protein
MYAKFFYDFTSINVCELVEFLMIKTIIVIFFSSVAHVWVRGANTTGPIVKKFGFS